MQRNHAYSALTLRVKPSGESNREAWFLTAEEGVIRATVFGGPKSRLRSQVAPFHGGTLWIYHDPVRDTNKVSDFDVKSWRPGIRELWERAMTAGAVAETVLASQGGGGNWEEAVKLAESVLDALEASDPPSCSRIGLYFLWHWAQILGVRPELNVSFSHSRLENGALALLKTIETTTPAALKSETGISLNVNLQDVHLFEQATAFAQAILAETLGKRLPTWDGM